MKWPLLRAALLYVAGVLLGSAVHASVYLLLALSFAVVGTALAWARLRPSLLLGVMLLAGWTNYTLQTAVISPHDLRRILSGDPQLATIRGVIAETPSLRVFELGETPVWRTLARIEVSAVRLDKQQWQPGSGRIAVATPGTLTNLFGGQEVEVFGVVAYPKGPIAEGTFDYRAFLAEQRVYYRLKADSEQDWTIIRSPRVAPLADRFRTWARGVLARGLPAEDESLRLEWALTLGWKTALDEESSEPFIRAATYHIFAVDGLRMAIVFGILFGLLRACNVPRAICGLGLLPLIWFYVALTGWPASAIRATVMLSIIIIGWALKRPSNLINSLLAAALIILVWEPQQLFQAGFQLSFLVVLCMILLLPPLIGFLRRLHELASAAHPGIARVPLLGLLYNLLFPDPLLPVSRRVHWPGFLRVPLIYCGDLFLASFAAWIGSIPLVAYYFNIVTPVSTPANIVAVPLCALVLVSNLGSLLLISWFPAAAELFNHAGWFLMECIRLTSVWFADWPKAWFYVPAPSLLTTSLYYGVLFAWVTGWLSKPAFRPVKIGALCLAAAVWGATLLPDLLTTRITIFPANGGLIVYADARGTRNDLLIDAGNTNAVQFVTKPVLRAHGVNALQNLALSHGDIKHVGGARVLSEIFPARRVWASNLRFRSTAYRRLLQDFETAPGLLGRLSRTDHLGPWQVLHPEQTDRYPRADDGALVLRGDINGTRLLLLSDLGRAGQEALLERTADLRADILVTGLPSTGEPIRDRLLDAIQPRVIIVGDSEFPASERARPPLRERLAKRHIPVIYTRDTGAATIELRGRGCKIRTMSGMALRSRQPLPEPPPARRD
ncbi:MAG TPA: ComEC/Rec2 family competence protein [Verrucomicrobiae bacterium]